MRRHPLALWALYSAPLLAVVALTWFGFDTETACSAFFKEHRAAHPVLKEIFTYLTNYGNVVFYGIFGFMLVRAWKTGNRDQLRYVIITLVVQALIAGLAVRFLKYTIGRPRPDQGGLFHPLSTRGSMHSLPSGHTAEFTGWSSSLGLRYGQLWLNGLLGLFLGAMGFSRIYLGWHYPTDVFFGWLLGSFTGFTVLVIYQSSLFTKRK